MFKETMMPKVEGDSQKKELKEEERKVILGAVKEKLENEGAKYDDLFDKAEIDVINENEVSVKYMYFICNAKKINNEWQIDIYVKNPQLIKNTDSKE